MLLTHRHGVFPVDAVQWIPASRAEQISWAHVRRNPEVKGELRGRSDFATYIGLVPTTYISKKQSDSPACSPPSYFLFSNKSTQIFNFGNLSIHTCGQCYSQVIKGENFKIH